MVKMLRGKLAGTEYNSVKIFKELIKKGNSSFKMLKKSTFKTTRARADISQDLLPFAFLCMRMPFNITFRKGPCFCSQHFS